MTDIFVERFWDEPLSEEKLQTLIDSSYPCLQTHRCDWRMSFLSADGHQLVCHFAAPDAESVRIALKQLGSPQGSIWAGTIHDAPGHSEEDLAKANVLVSRRFDKPADFAQIQALEDAGANCLETHRVKFIRTLFSRDKTRMICLYNAPDAESVRIAQREAHMPVDQVWAIRRFHP